MTALHSMSSQIKTQPRTISPTLTGAGVMAAINVPKTGIEVAVTHIAFGTGKYRPNGAETGLQHEMMRVAIAGGGKVSPTQIQVHAEAIAPVGSPFWCGEIGFYAGETLFAVYSKPDQPILYFADDSVTTVSYTLGLAALPADTVTVLVDPNVNTAIQLIGAHETAGDPHPQYLTKPRGNALYVNKSGDVMGQLSVASGKADPTYSAYGMEIREALRATDSMGRDISYAPKMIFHWGGVCVTQIRLTADNVLEVVGGDGASYGALQVGSFNATTSMTLGGRPIWHQGNFDPNSKQDTIGFKPVQQGTGIGQTLNDVKIGWSENAGLKATVDTSDQGSFVFADRLIRLNWNGLGGQPPWLLGGAAAGDVNLYDPLNFNVNSAQKAYAVNNGADWMKFMWGDSGSQTTWVWGSDSPTSARLMTTANLRVGHARAADMADTVATKDTRDSNFAPQDRSAGVYFDMKNGVAIGLNDGSTYIAAMTIRAWGVGADFSGGNAHQLGFSDTHTVWYRSGKTAAWSAWYKFWHSGNFDPASKQNALGYTPVQQGGGAGQSANKIYMGWANDKGLKVTVDGSDQGSVVFGEQAMRLNWSGMAGQPPWLLGGASPGQINVYNPSDFSVKYAANAGLSQTAEKISNGNTYMRLQWSDPGGQPIYLWGSDGADSARLAVIGNLNVARSREADNATKVGGVPMRFQENPQSSQPYYIYGAEAGRTEITLYNRAALAVGSCMSAMYANQLSGQGLGYGGVGGYILNKRKDGTGLAGIWEQRGQVYDFGSGASEGNESSAVLWQRVA
jgi:Phage tail-collar fibre protein